MQGTVARNESKMRIECLGREVVDPIERGGRRQQAQVVRAFRQQAVDECGVDAVGREHRVRDALRRILIVVETRGSETEIEVADDGVELEVARNRPGDIVRDGRCPDPAFCPDHGDDAPDRLGIGRGKQPADRPHDVDRADRQHQVVADPAAHQLAIEDDVVMAPDDDHARARVADLGERIEAAEEVVSAALGLDHDDVRRRRSADTPRPRR